MIRQIAPQFFTLDIPGTLAYYTDKLGFRCLGTWQEPPVYAIVARDQHKIHFRRSEEHTSELQSRLHLVCRLLLEKEQLKLIANFGTGVGNIDVKAAHPRGIMVTNTPGVLTQDTADMPMALILAVPRLPADGFELL